MEPKSKSGALKVCQGSAPSDDNDDNDVIIIKFG